MGAYGQWGFRDFYPGGVIHAMVFLLDGGAVYHVNRGQPGQLTGDGLEGWGEGAAVSCYQSRPAFSKCLFLRNWAGGLGAGVLGYLALSGPSAAKESARRLQAVRFRHSESTIDKVEAQLRNKILEKRGLVTGVPAAAEDEELEDEIAAPARRGKASVNSSE